MRLHGRAWTYGDGLSATDIVPAAYDHLSLVYDWTACAVHLMEGFDPEFVSKAKAGDVIVAGKDLGAGHAHYHITAIMACRARGIGAILADSADMLFQRAGIDHGLPVWAYPGISGLFATGDGIDFDLATGLCLNTTTGTQARFPPLPPMIGDILAAGSSLDWALARKAAAETLTPSS